jgi:hypothetical protein
LTAGHAQLAAAVGQEGGDSGSFEDLPLHELNSEGGNEPAVLGDEPAAFDVSTLRKSARKRKRVHIPLRVRCTKLSRVPQPLVAGRFEPGPDRMFDPPQFFKIEEQVGRKFSLEAASREDGSNSLVPENHCSPARPFQEEPAAGHNVWANPPFDQAVEFLQHYLLEKEKDPTNT